jgi:hypothetical protein
MRLPYREYQIPNPRQLNPEKESGGSKKVEIG